MAVQAKSAPPMASRGFHWAFVIAWIFCLLFYFTQYAIRSAPGVMIPELTAAFSLSAVGVSSLLGVYYYTADSSSEGNTRAVSSMFRVGRFVQQGVENLVGRCV